MPYDLELDVAQEEVGLLKAERAKLHDLLKKLWATTYNRELMQEIEEAVGEKGPYRRKSE